MRRLTVLLYGARSKDVTRHLPSVTALHLSLSLSLSSKHFYLSLTMNVDLCEATLLAGPLVGGLLSAFKTSAAVRSEWYKTLRQPWFKPPDQVR
jgi:hypothetical protein